MFFQRGGSAHVIRSLATRLPAEGWDVTIVSGSRRDCGGHGDARRFYRDLDVREVDFTQALAAPDPMDPPGGAPPMHPSCDDRRDAPDRVFASLDDRALRRQVDAWARALADAGAAEPDVLHLHHLTPINEAARRVAPDVPVVGHLHGTELLMLDAMEVEPDRWPHAREWARRLREWAAACERLIVLSDSQVARAERLLGIEPARCVRVANGFDPGTFRPRHVDHRAHWRAHLVEAPQGWGPGEEAGSVRYAEADLAAFGDGRGE